MLAMQNTRGFQKYVSHSTQGPCVKEMTSHQNGLFSSTVGTLDAGRHIVWWFISCLQTINNSRSPSHSLIHLPSIGVV